MSNHTADLATRARYRQEGAELERERIINLLEQSLNYSETDLCLFWANGEQTQATLNGLIALIKGEQK